MPSDYDLGVLVGLLVGEGHFGGDGRQPQITLRMHVRHEAMFNWIESVFPGGKLYGPYHHDGRHYYQWMARGAYLRDVLFPLLRPRILPELDAHAAQRFSEMESRYARILRPPEATEEEQGSIDRPMDVPVGGSDDKAPSTQP